MAVLRTSTIVFAAIVVAACTGGGDAPSSADGSPDPPSGASSRDFETPDTSDPPWLVDLTDPTGPLLDSWMVRAVTEPTPTEPPDGTEARLVWIYEALIELWRADSQFAALGMGDPAVDPTHAELTPRAGIDIIGAASLMLADSYALLGASSELAAGAGGPDEPMFTAWSQFAEYWVTAGLIARDATAAARDLDPSDQSCYLAAIGSGLECEGPGLDLGTQAIIDLDEQYQAIDALELDTPDAYAAAGTGFDVCRAWEQAVEVTELSVDEELRIWIAIDDSDLDVFFIGLSECAREVDVMEDPETDGLADLAIFQDYLTSVAEAILETGYDASAVEMAEGSDDEQRAFEAVAAEATGRIVSSSRDSASWAWSDALNSEFAAKLYMVTGIEIDDWVELGDIDLDWFDLGDTICDEWTSLLVPYPAVETAAIEAAVEQLGLAGSVIPEPCG